VNVVYFNSKYNNVSNLTASRAITDYAITATTIFCNSKYNNVSKVTASRAITDYAITEITIFCNSKYNNVFSFDFRCNAGLVTLTAMLSLIGVSF
jgi:hypothetical protein